MRFVETALAGAFVVELERHVDERGSFARTFCVEELAARGLVATVAQCSLSTNLRRGTLRGLHYQRAPHGEVKLVRCTRGRIHDVIVDLRPASPTFRRHVAVELRADDGTALYVPEGFAHGFQTLEDESHVFYMMSAPYRADAGAGVRWDDPALAIDWPLPEPILSARDAAYPDLGERR